MKYSNRLNYRDRRLLLVKLRVVYLLIALILIGAIIYFVINYFRDKNNEISQKATSQETSSFIAPSVGIFKTPYYQFQATKDWVEVPNESTATKFVYRSIKNNIIGHQLDIYVNEIPANLEATRTLPVSFVTNSTELNPSTVSEHCIKALDGKSNQNPIRVNFANVKFNCDSDSTKTYSILVGQIGDDSVLNMIRPDGTTVAFTIFYNNLQAIPEPNELVQITKTFQTR